HNYVAAQVHVGYKLVSAELHISDGLTWARPHGARMRGGQPRPVEPGLDHGKFVSSVETQPRHEEGRLEPPADAGAYLHGGTPCQAPVEAFRRRPGRRGHGRQSRNNGDDRTNSTPEDHRVSSGFRIASGRPRMASIRAQVRARS